VLAALAARGLGVAVLPRSTSPTATSKIDAKQPHRDDPA
jgi:hypothetical protein